MLDNLLQGKLAADGWALVIGIGLLFFLAQVVLCLLFCRRLRRQERTLQSLLRAYDEGEDGRTDSGLRVDELSWYYWVVSQFPEDATRGSSSFSREDALQELDTRIAGNGHYLLLQRMGVMAPLLGVVLTVAGFFWLNVGENEQSLQSILLAVTPLVSGVGTGAILALINQVLLHIAGRRVESLRLTGRTWFDTVIWQSLCGDNQAAAVTTEQVVEGFLRGALDDVERLAETLSRAAEINAVLAELPERIRNTFDRKLSLEQKRSVPNSGDAFVTRLPRTPR